MYVYLQNHPKVEPGRPSRRNCLARLGPQSFGMLKQSKITFGLGLKCSIESRRTVCKDNRKADVTTTGLMTPQLGI